MRHAPPHEYLVPFDGSFELGRAAHIPPDDAPSDKRCKKQLEELVDELDQLQRRLYADDRWSVLLVFQAMDAAGKDSTIRAVLRGVNPAGCQVYSFKKPSARELDHDFLWRTAQRMPQRGRIGVFNRSYYEEALVVRVHPEYLGGQRLPERQEVNELFAQRFESFRDHELHLARNGTLVLKFFLNVSKEEQRQRFLARIDQPSKNWKFSGKDVEERQHWNEYMAAYEEVLRETSRPWAPWYAIPADNKPFMRYQVAQIITQNLERLGLAYPQLDVSALAELGVMRERLISEG